MTISIDGVTWALVRHGHVLLEQCPKKARKMAMPEGTWFVPGGKIEGAETEAEALVREIGEEWPGVRLEEFIPLPLVQASLDGDDVWLMRPYLVEVSGKLPDRAANGVPLEWWPEWMALESPVPQVRMVTAAAVGKHRQLGRI